MDSTDPRTQPTVAAVAAAAAGPQINQHQPHHHHQQQQQHLTQQHRQQQPQQQPNNPTQHIQQQHLHQQQPQTTHPPQHAQPNQSTGYATQPQAHTYPQHQMQFPHAYPPSQPHFQRYPQPPYTHIPQYQQQYPVYANSPYPQTSWVASPGTFAPVTVSTPPTQGMASTPKATSQAPRVKQILQFIHPDTRMPIDLTEEKKSDKSDASKSTDVKGSTNATKITNPTPNKAINPAAPTNSKISSTSGAAVATTTTSSTPTNRAIITQQSTTTTTTTTTTRINDVTKSSAVDRTGTSSPPSVSNILLMKVSEDTSSKKRQDVSPKATTAPVVPSKAIETIKSPTKEKMATSTTDSVVAESTPVAVSEIDTPVEEVKKEVIVEEKDKKKEDANKETVVNNVEANKEVVGVKDGCDDDSTIKSGEADGEIELHYQDGQYNPRSNRGGKKKYSREFMVEVCEKVCKLSLSNEQPADGGSQPYIIDGVDMFMPQFNQNRFPNNRPHDQTRRPNSNYTGRSSAGQERPRKIIAPSSSLTNEVELKTVSNPWRPGKEAKEDVAPNEAEVESLKKKFRSILNKLTPNNFDNLALAVTDLQIDTETKLGEVIDIVFAKALAEPGYCVLYGQMCSHLKKITAGTANFGNTLLRRCQVQFNADIYTGLNVDERKQKIENEEDPEKKKQQQEELYENMYRSRMRSLGLIKFIGELYKIEMLNDSIMFDCIQRLLADAESEEFLECLCDLLTTVGEKLDRSSSKLARDKQKSQKNAPKGNAYQSGKSAASVVAAVAQQRAPDPAETLDSIFEQLHRIRKDKTSPLSLRIRFKLLDVCELREKENWQSKKTKDNNPKKIEEIKKEHFDKLESERLKLMGPRRSQEGGGGRRLGHAGGSSSQISSLGNDSSANRSNFHTSASSQSMRDHFAGEKALQNNSDQHKQAELHRATATNLLLKFRQQDDDKTTKSDGQGGLRPITSSLRPQSLKPSTAFGASANATATSNATNTTSSN